MLLVSNGDGLGLARRMHLDGFHLDLFVDVPFSRQKGVMQGLVPQVNSLEEGLARRPEAVLFDSSARGLVADQLASWVPVFGAGALQDALEFRRGWALEVMTSCGIKVPPTFVFGLTDGHPWQAMADHRNVPAVHKVLGHVPEAQAFLRAVGGRWVAKPYAAEASADTYVAHDPEEMIEHLQHVCEEGLLSPDDPFVLQAYLPGIEVSTEVWWHRGIPVPGSWTGTFEEKKFMVGGLGPATGAQISTVWAYPKAPKIFEETFGNDRFLAWMREPIGPDGTPARPITGPLDLNCIIADSDRKPYALEWCPRMGWSAWYDLAVLINAPLYDVLVRAAQGRLDHLPLKSGYAHCVQMSVPPFPANEEINVHKDFGHTYKELMRMATGIDISGPVDSLHCWLIDARVKDGNLETTGVDGIVGNVSGWGKTIEEARDASHALFNRIQVANKQGRLADSADRALREGKRLRDWGYQFPTEGSP